MYGNWFGFVCTVLGISLLLLYVLPAYSGQEAIKLPSPQYNSNMSVEKALQMRRSIRAFSDEPLTIKEVSQLLWATQGVTDERGFRTSPSAGALYPLEVYIATGNVTDLADGVYKYNPYGHEIEKVLNGDKRTELFQAALKQVSVKHSALVIVISAIYERTTAKYGKRGIRYVHMEAGHAAQNVFLQSVSLGLGMVVIGAFQDSKVSEVLKMSQKEKPLYIIPVGRIGKSN
jgi:SagB-type dehydrogenase family enzyme